MLEKVALFDFQAHEKFVLEFDPQVTTIVGENDVGKSTVLRALYFLCLNEQTRWDKLVRWGKEGCKIVLRVDGHKIVRQRGKSLNSYSLDGKKFVAFGTKVPEPVAAVLNVTWDNFQQQLDSHFWFGDSGGDVSKRLNEIVNLSQIDRALSYLSSESRRATAVVDLSTERVESLQEEVTSLEWVPECEKDYGKLVRAESLAAETREKAASLARMLSEAESLQDVVDRASATKDVAGKLLADGERALLASGRATALQLLLSHILRTKEVMRVPVPDDLDALLAVRKEGDAIAERRRNLEYLLADVIEAKSVADAAARELSEFVVQTGVCPTCLRPTTKSSPSSSVTYTSPTSPP